MGPIGSRLASLDTDVMDAPGDGPIVSWLSSTSLILCVLQCPVAETDAGILVVIGLGIALGVAVGFSLLLVVLRCIRQ